MGHVLRSLVLLSLGAMGFFVGTSLASAPSSSDTDAWFRLRGKVTRVVDGDTLDVQVGRRRHRVRLIGIDTPEQGACYFSEATTAARRLAYPKTVTLIGDRTQDRTDRYGRLLAYVIAPGGVDVGRELIANGYAVVYVFERDFARVQSYRSAETDASASLVGLWASCRAAPPGGTTTTATTGTTATTATTPPSSRCHASYPGVCIPPSPPDLDCKDVPYADFIVRHDVSDPDPHRFDGDKDGIGCEG